MAPQGPQEPRRQGNCARPPDLPPRYHATLTNKELERGYATAEALRAHPEIAKFVAWIEGKDPDFHAPTRRRKV
jgi:hypothetical protein